MTVTRLSNVFIPEVYGSYQSVDSPELSRLVQSGIIATNELMNGIARSGGRLATIPFWNDISASSEPNYSNDDPADLATADNITAGNMVACKAWVNKGFGEMDIVPDLAGSSPMQHIRNRFGTYWMRQMERRLIASCVGVYNSNVDNDGGDMVIDISGLAGENAVFNNNSFIDAAYTMGENVRDIVAIAVHSSIEARMVKNDSIVYIPDSQGNLTIPTYMGRLVIADDNMPVSNGVYTSILFGRSAFGFGGVEGSMFALGEGVPKAPFEIWRDPHQGQGGGVEEIWERRTWIVHPFGFTWLEPTSPALTEYSPTLADLRLADHWSRVVSRKNVPMAFLLARADQLVSSSGSP